MDHNTQDTAKPLLCAGENLDLTSLWLQLQEEARTLYRTEPLLQALLDDVILQEQNFASGLATRLSRKLAREDMQAAELRQVLMEVFESDPGILQSAARDLTAIFQRDPACHSTLVPLLFYKGFHAITNYRISHHLWKNERQSLALYFQSIGNEIFQVDIHPAAQLGCGLLLDHGTSFVVGETGIIEDNVSILHEVTLGGTGKETGLRHPIVRSGVLLGAGAKILGRVEIGANAKVGAGSVVLSDVESNTTVAGVPAKIVGSSKNKNPAMEMDQSLYCDHQPETSLDSAAL